MTVSFHPLLVLEVMKQIVRTLESARTGCSTRIERVNQVISQLLMVRRGAEMKVATANGLVRLSDVVSGEREFFRMD